MTEETERVARIIAYEMGDTMGDAEPVFWNGYNYKDSARKAAEKVLASLPEHTLLLGRVAELEEQAEIVRCYMLKAGQILAPHSGEPAGTPLRDALVAVNAALYPAAREHLRSLKHQEG